MSNTNQLAMLNGVQTLLISEANANGINLADNFATVEDFKKFVITMSIRALVDAGQEFRTAFEMVLGEGSYETMAHSVYDQINAA